MTEVAENTSEETTQVAESTVSTGYIGDDGNFTDGWMEAAGVHEDLRSNLTLKSTKNLAGMASQLVNAQSMVGKNTIAIPTEDSTDSEWEAFKDNFRPATAGDYSFEHAEEVGEVNAEFETSIKEFAHSEGIRPSTMQKLIEIDDQRMIGMREAMAQATEQEKTTATETLKKEWGAAYDQRLHLANRMIEENVSEANKEAVLKAIGNDPRVADMLANMAKKFVEHRVIDADVDIPTPNDALAEIDNLRNTTGYMTGELSKSSPAKYKQITEQIAGLYQKVYPKKG